MKKALRWILLALLSPVLLVLLVAVLLYVPPVQQWAVSKAAAIASEATGLDVSVGHVRLKFPLDLALDDVLVMRQGDTIASIGRAVVDVQLRPLFSKQVVVDELDVSNTRLNTLDLVSDVQVQGSVGHLSASSRGIDLDRETVLLDGTLIEDADLLVQLSDTAAVDTTTSDVRWRIDIDEATLRRSRLQLHMPGDTLLLTASLQEAIAREGVVDLGQKHYHFGQLTLADGAVAYDATTEDTHLALNGLQLRADSLDMDSMSLRLPHLQLSTPYSTLAARAAIDLNVMDSISPGQLDLDLTASLGKQDLVSLVPDLATQWPDWQLTLGGHVSGNMEEARVERLVATLPTALHAEASGTVRNVANLDRLWAQLDVSADITDLDFALRMAAPDVARDYRIPHGLQLNGLLSADGPRYAADLAARQGRGTATLKGTFDQEAMAYEANATIHQLDVRQLMPRDSIGVVSASLRIKGQGTDFLSPHTFLDADGTVAQLHYGHWDLDDLTLSAHLKNGRAMADVSGCNQLFEGTVAVDALLDKRQLQATVDADLQHLDLYYADLTDAPLTLGGTASFTLQSDLEQTHKASGQVKGIYLRDSLKTYHPEDVGLLLATNPDTTRVRAQSGSLIVKLDAQGGYEPLFSQLSALADTIVSDFEHRVIDQPRIKAMLPTMSLYVTSGRDNPVANILRASQGVDFRELLVDLNTSPETGLNGKAHLFALNYDSIRIDTIDVAFTQRGEKLSYSGQVTNNRRNPQFVFRTLFDGHLTETGALLGVRYYDSDGKLGVRLGTRADMVSDGIRFQLLPQRPTIGYKEFTLNDDNFLLLRNDLKLQAKVNLLADDGTGLRIYSEDQDSTLLQDLTLSFFSIDLKEVTSVLPYMPRITGQLDGDFHLVMDQERQVSVVSDLGVTALTYEGSAMGNLSTELVYLQREDDTHAVEGQLLRDGTEIALFQGSYKSEGGHIDGKLTMTQTPLELINGFVPDQLVGLEGTADGELSVQGTTSRPIIDGEVMLENSYLVSQPYGIRLQFDDDPVRIQQSRLLLENFTLYSASDTKHDNPLNIVGNIDFSDLDRMTMDVRMRAQNYQLINAKQTAKSIAYGKAFVNFFGRMQGPLAQLQMRGRLDVLGSTDVTYLLLDSPLSTDNQMDELVKFTDFSDTTQTVVSRPEPDGLNVNMSISIDQGAHVRCGLNVDQTNYVDIFGGGDLRMKYTAEGIDLTGRYTIASGEMKYSLPVIPLKTFTIQDGSYVEFTGDPMNPRLNLTATERVKATVGQDGSQSRSVSFDCGVVITKTLNDMGLEFIIDAPEDNTISSELASMSTEQRGKLAVTMLTTGMYLADGNTSGFSMNSALSSFLQSEINSITGNALKTLDLSIGLDNTTDASGTMHTDYSFKFAKRFWNNRLKVQIGGKVSTGNDVAGQNQSFFDNVTMEYRLSPTSNQYLSLFYNQNAYDWLEGYTGEYGGGFIWRRKLDHFLDIFTIWKKDTSSLLTMPRQLTTPTADSLRTATQHDSLRTAQPQDTLRTDSITPNRNAQ